MLLGFTIDAEEAERLEISLEVIDAVLSDPRLAGWDGLAWLFRPMDCAHHRFWIGCTNGPVSLTERSVASVKGAYWDAEIKRAQVEGLAQFPVFTRKTATDIAYIDCARRLLAMAGRVYPQFATHNAHSVAAILELAGDNSDFEFQKLHGMSDALHGAVMETGARRCRIYAPVGPHRDLLAYLCAGCWKTVQIRLSSTGLSTIRSPHRALPLIHLRRGWTSPAPTLLLRGLPNFSRPSGETLRAGIFRMPHIADDCAGA